LHSPLVHTIVLFAVPVSEEMRYLSLVVAFSSILKDGTTFSALRASSRSEAMLEVLGQICCWSLTPSILLRNKDVWALEG